MLSGASVPRRRAGVEVEVVGEQAVMLDSAGTTARGLNASARRVWELIDGRRTIAEIARELHRHAKVDDVSRFVEALKARGLVDVG